MSFGFDPSIILSASKAAEGNITDTLQSLAQLQAHKTQQQQAQAQLAELAQKQQDEQALSGIYRANADTPDTLASALMRGGFGPQAYAAQDQASQMRSQDAQRAKLLQEVQNAHRKHVGELFYGTKDDADYQARRQELASNPDPMLAVYAHALPEKFDPGVTERLGNLAMSAKDRADLKQKELDRAAAEQRARIMAGAKVQAASAGGAAPADLSPEALDAMAAQYSTTGQLPQLGMGKSGAALRVKIANRASQLSPGADLAGNKAAYSADSKSLASQQKQADAVEAFENTAGKNLDTFLEVAKKVSDTGSPLFNAPGRKFADMVAGNPQMAAFKAARQTAVTEIGKVLSGGMGGGALSDSARHEVQELIGPDASLAQIKAAAEILKRDMANRKAAVGDQLKATRSRMGGKPATASASGKLSKEEADELAQLRKELGQ